MGSDSSHQDSTTSWQAHYHTFTDKNNLVQILVLNTQCLQDPMERRDHTQTPERRWLSGYFWDICSSPGWKSQAKDIKKKTKNQNPKNKKPCTHAYLSFLPKLFVFFHNWAAVAWTLDSCHSLSNWLHLPSYGSKLWDLWRRECSPPGFRWAAFPSWLMTKL